MKKGNILFVTGIIISSIAGCCLASDGIWLHMAIAVTLFGLVLTEIGWRYECEKRRKRKMEEADRQRRLASCWACYLSSNLLAGRDNSDM